MADRITHESDWSFADLILKNGVTPVKGQMACMDTATGTVTIGAASTTLVPIGYFLSSTTNGGLASGNGTDTIGVRFFKEKRMHWFANDGTNPVLAANLGSNVYIVDGQTVSISSATSTRSIAGRAFALDSKLGVLVEPAL